ncbi:anaphase-promoting complex, subunit 10 [Rhizoctonia solani AG-3 Rhs1AP]|uniref:Anaphase-promoting complex subunit 10 n=2 Tax=Rhizoctonia solani AG-3 TaxID=1086053 RepID=A0A074S485_9AGAM|nr:anaphase-promoting complex, subunit 10 [Rhizoctonia solani AG-3 Rhs1AP]KEP51683.1 anaphase-promoting complex subunit 10 [Rhizoctonia solani 123E]
MFSNSFALISTNHLIDHYQSKLPDIGHLATWSVSSYKYGFNVDCLRDDDPETFWQSDGPQPHYITLQFHKKVAVQKIAILLKFDQDDSYTPVRLAIRAGMSLNDLQEVRYVGFEKPNEWLDFDVSMDLSDDGTGARPLHCYAIQIMVAANYMNGKDTHIRGLKVLGPHEPQPGAEDTIPYTSLAFQMHECIR